jgi:hypothetical protein
MPRRDTPRKLPAGSIFLCYRREDSADSTGRLYDRLITAFDEAAVFKDVDSIPFGVDFRSHVQQVIAKTQVVLVIIGRRWQEVTDQAGRVRLDDELDHVRVEIEAALSRPDILVIPVLVQDAKMPARARLSETLKPLTFRNGLAVRRDPDFHADADRLIRQLNEFFDEQTAPPIEEQDQPVVPAGPPSDDAAFVRAWTALFVAGGMMQVFLSSRWPEATMVSAGLAWVMIALGAWWSLRARVSLSAGWMLGLIAAGLLPSLVWSSFTAEDADLSRFLVFTILLGLVEGGVRGYVLWQGVGRRVGMWAFVRKNVGAAMAAQGVYLVVEAVLLVAIARVPLTAAWSGRSVDGVTSLFAALSAYAGQDRLSTLAVLPALAYWFVYGRWSGAITAWALQGTPTRSPASMTTATVVAAVVGLLCVVLTYARQPL